VLKIVSSDVKKLRQTSLSLSCFSNEIWFDFFHLKNGLFGWRSDPMTHRVKKYFITFHPRKNNGGRSEGDGFARIFTSFVSVILTTRIFF
jgi:hypothetical protein